MTTTVLAVPVETSVRERLAKLARTTGRTEEDIAAEAINGLLALNDRQVAGIEAAIQSMDRGEGIPHQEVTAWIDSLGTERPLPRPARKDR